MSIALQQLLDQKPSSAAELRGLLQLYMRLHPSSPQWLQTTDLIVGTLLLREIRRQQEIEDKTIIVPPNGGDDAGT